MCHLRAVLLLVFVQVEHVLPCVLRLYLTVAVRLLRLLLVGRGGHALGGAFVCQGDVHTWRPIHVRCCIAGRQGHRLIKRSKNRK